MPIAGTVYELGYMAGRGKFCLGYSNDPAIYADRVRDFTTVEARDGRLIDADGLTVEDFGLSDNLMMIHALELHGAPLVTAACKTRGHLARPDRVRGLRAPGGGTAQLTRQP